MRTVKIDTSNISQFIGKRLYTSYSGYAGQDGDDNFVLGEVI